ncbi:metal-dependent hydrolase [Candidatus Woesearchaeota archaeon]|nr:metal-dependent hydrolase [Candidatus Woesearchaeota archaeon]
MFKTHIVAGFLAGILLIPYLNPANQILFMALVLIGAILPDIDHPNSKLGKRVKVVSMFFEHRGFFHSFLVLPVIALILYYFTKTNFYSVPLVIGYISHLLTDAVTKEGIMVFHPISKARIRGFIATGGAFEYVLLVIFFIFAVIKTINL